MRSLIVASILIGLASILTHSAHAGGYCAPGYYKPPYTASGAISAYGQNHVFGQGAYYGAGYRQAYSTYPVPSQGELYAADVASAAERKAIIQRDFAITQKVDAALEKGRQAENDFYRSLYESAQKRFENQQPTALLPKEEKLHNPIDAAVNGGALSSSCLKCHSVEGSDAANKAYYRTTADIWLDFDNAYDQVFSGAMPPNNPYDVSKRKEWIVEISPTK